MLIGALIGFAVALAMVVMNKRNATAGTGVAGQVEVLLRTSEPLTLKQIAAKLGKDSLTRRGAVLQALAALQSVGKVKVNPAPEGTPQLKKVDVITYEAVSTGP